ncbi:MAG: tRNA (adenosine(37)-N6)-threonylcarbamoyltransferase complex ATPase subunit type 1 TsaE, partial [Methanomassiliicoccales archaeon]
TTLAKGLGRGLECEVSITSPTFTIMNIYQGRLTMYHCDFYRLSGDDTEQLGIKEIIGLQGLFVVEWAGMVTPNILPDGINIELSLAGDDYDGPRQVSFTAQSVRGKELLKELESCQYWR